MIFITSHRDAIRAPDSSGRPTQFLPIAPAAIRRRLPDLPDVSVTPDGEYLLSAVLISPDGELVDQGRISGRCAQGFPFAPTAIWGHLPFLPEGVVVTYSKDFLAAVRIPSDDVRLDVDL